MKVKYHLIKIVFRYILSPDEQMKYNSMFSNPYTVFIVGTSYEDVTEHIIKKVGRKIHIMEQSQVEIINQITDTVVNDLMEKHSND